MTDLYEHRSTLGAFLFIVTEATLMERMHAHEVDCREVKVHDDPLDFAALARGIVAMAAEDARSFGGGARKSEEHPRIGWRKIGWGKI
ncbi:hypothetical protein CRG98_043974 [Punica granatum]|uniref:Uncharacterized protein n=1 Tax=Punica granatum TaxID=22663 RepID=A0A2I0HVH9_PUNGR|nr:hypothetical protein CRG98_043974 [Punica granatum]